MIADLFDSAASALLTAQASRRYATGPGFPTENWTKDEQRQFFVQLQQRGITRFVQAQEDARVALAKLEPYIPAIRGEVVEEWELRESRVSAVRDLIEARRRQAIKSERLFRLRRAPDPVANPEPLP